MSDVILVAIISAASSVICQVIISRKTLHDTDIKTAVERQIVNDRLSAIETKLDTHNGYAEKLGSIQRDIAVLSNEIKNIKE